MLQPSKGNKLLKGKMKSDVKTIGFGIKIKCKARETNAELPITIFNGFHFFIHRFFLDVLAVFAFL